MRNETWNLPPKLAGCCYKREMCSICTSSLDDNDFSKKHPYDVRNLPMEKRNVTHKNDVIVETRFSFFLKEVNVPF